MIIYATTKQYMKEKYALNVFIVFIFKSLVINQEEPSIILYCELSKVGLESGGIQIELSK